LIYGRHENKLTDKREHFTGGCEAVPGDSVRDRELGRYSSPEDCEKEIGWLQELGSSSSKSI
jgi:hypothetical protein